MKSFFSPFFFLMIFPAKSWTIYVASETQSCTVWDAMTKWGHQSVVLVGKYTWNASHLQVNFQFEYNSPLQVNIKNYYSTIMAFYHIRVLEQAKHTLGLLCGTGEKDSKKAQSQNWTNEQLKWPYKFPCPCK